MDIGALLFALGLLMVGIWLIFKMSSDLKEKTRRPQAVAITPQRKPQPARQVSARVRQPLESRPRALEPPPAPQTERIGASPAGGERSAAGADQWEYLNVAMLRETFEKFTRR